MPGNQVVINSAIKYYVGDSKMEELLAWLDSNGIKKGEENLLEFLQNLAANNGGLFKPIGCEAKIE